MHCRARTLLPGETIVAKDNQTWLDTIKVEVRDGWFQVVREIKNQVLIE
jgi:hypothetical protein